MEREDAGRHETAGEEVVVAIGKTWDAGFARKGIPLPVPVGPRRMKAQRRRLLTNHGFQLAATPRQAFRVGREPVAMLDDEHRDSSAEQVLDVMQRITGIGEPWRKVLKPLDKFPKLGELVLRKPLV